MIKGPGIPAGKRINALVQNYDISATIVNWLGIKGSEAMDSIDLMPLVLGQTEKIRDYVITGYHNAAWAIFTEEWSYVHWLVEQALVNSTAGTNLGMMDGNDGGVKADDIANFNIDNEGREALERYKKGLTLDGADQWTCTPGSVLEAPDTDQLFDRKKDPFQLSNVISQHPDVAAKLLRELNNRMEELKR